MRHQQLRAVNRADTSYNVAKFRIEANHGHSTQTEVEAARSTTPGPYGRPSFLKETREGNPQTLKRGMGGVGGGGIS